MLKVADAAAVIDRRLGGAIWSDVDRNRTYGWLRKRLGERTYLADMLARCASKHALRFGIIARAVAAAPPQTDGRV